MNNAGERGQPCRRPLEDFISPYGLPLMRTENEGEDTQLMMREERWELPQRPKGAEGVAFLSWRHYKKASGATS